MKKKQVYYYVVGILFVTLLFTSFALNPAGVRAQGEEEEDGDDDYDDVDEEIEQENERSVDIWRSDSEIGIYSEREVPGREDYMELSIRTENVSVEDEDEGLVYYVAYASETEASEYEIEFVVAFHNLIEFSDDDGDGIYNENEDTAVQTKLLTNFLPLSYAETTADSGEPIYEIEVETADSIFLSRIYVVSEFAQINSSTISPSQVKIDVEINDFPFERTDSKLALQVRIVSESEYEEVDETEDEEQGRSQDEQGVELGSGESAGFFSWVETALVDGVEKPVESSPVVTDESDEAEKRVYLIYPQGSSIIHDPKIGVKGITTYSAPDNAIPGFAAMLPISLIAVGLVAYLFSKNKHH